MKVTVKLTFGFASVGSYQATLFDKNDKNGHTFDKGTSIDNKPDVIDLPEPAQGLLKRTLLIEAALVPPMPPDMVSLTAEVLQGGKVIPDASMTSKAAIGPGQKATPMLFIRFE